MEAKYSKKWIFGVFCISLFIIYLYLGEAILDINDWVYSLWGDSFKNYYHIVFAAKNSQGLWLS